MSRPAKGLSLVEAVISIVLVGMTLVAALQTVGAAARTRSMTRDLATAELLASQLLAEVVQLPYNDPELGGGSIGADPGENNRSDFDDVDDFDDWIEGPPEDRNGTQRAGYSDWIRRVDVTWVASDPAIGAFSDLGRKKIVVRVWRSTKLMIELHALRSAAMPGWEDMP